MVSPKTGISAGWRKQFPPKSRISTIEEDEEEEEDSKFLRNEVDIGKGRTIMLNKEGHIIEQTVSSSGTLSDLT
jgi:hypothetical protein